MVLQFIHKIYKKDGTTLKISLLDNIKEIGNSIIILSDLDYSEETDKWIDLKSNSSSDSIKLHFKFKFTLKEVNLNDLLVILNKELANDASQADLTVKSNLNNQLDYLKKEKEEFFAREIKLTKKIKKLKSQLSSQKQEYEAKLQKQKEKIQKLKEENDKFHNIQKIKEQKSKEIEILDSAKIRSLETIEEISYNNNGKVLKVAMKEIYVLKVMNIKNANEKSLRDFINEYEILNFLKHPNILKTFGIFLSDEQNPPSILLEFCPLNLDQAIKNNSLSKSEIVYSIFQIAEGMKFVHCRKVIHRDLKPSNILISNNGIVKIADFGISKLMTPEEQSMTFGIGTQKFMAPEIINEEKYDEKIDVYSFGVLLFFVLSGGNMPNIKIRDICNGKKAEIPETFTEFSKKLINSCWNFESKDRPNFDSICEQIETNNFELLELTEVENKEVHDYIDQYKKQIPC